MLSRPTVILPKWVSFCLAKYFTLRSKWHGKQFRLPFWGFTMMEAYKVRIRAEILQKVVFFDCRHLSSLRR